MRLLFAALFVAVGILYLNHPEKLFKIHAFLRETFFNDALISLHRKTIGLIFLLAGLILLASGL